MSGGPSAAVRVLGIGEPDPPRLPWRPLRVVVEDDAHATLHHWSMGGDLERAGLASLPSSIFDEACDLGEAVRLDPPLLAQPSDQVVRDTDGEYRLLPKRRVRALRAKALAVAVRDALHALERGDVERCLDLLYRGCLAETGVPMASVVLVGLASEHDGESWSEAAVSRGVSAAEDCDLRDLARSLAWRALPYPERREALLQRTEAYLRNRAASEDGGLPRPSSATDLADAALLLAVRRLLPWEFPSLLRLPHRTLARLTHADPQVVASVLHRLGGERGAQGRSEQRASLRAAAVVAVDEARLSDLTDGFLAKVRRSDWLGHTRALATLDATLGNSDRSAAWRSGRPLLPRAWIGRPGQAPWEAGEMAANELRARLPVDPSDPIPAVGRTAGRRFGLVAFGTRMSRAPYDACHVVSTLPPTAYLDVDQVLPNSARQRFAIAKNIGFQIFARRTPGAHLSTSPRLGSDTGARTEAEQAANAFSAYFLAPRRAVCQATARADLMSPSGYEQAVREVVSRFGVSASCAFHHVANCHGKRDRDHWEWYDAILDNAQSAEDASFDEDPVEVPELPEGSTVPLERADGFCSRLAEVVTAGHLEFDDAARYLGGELADAQQLLRQRLAEIPG